MSLPKQTLALLQAARDIIKSQTADAILFLTETSLDWDEVRSHLKNCRLIVTAVNEETATKLRAREDLEVIDIDPEPVPSTERMSLALLKAVSLGRIQPGARRRSLQRYRHDRRSGGAHR